MSKQLQNKNAHHQEPQYFSRKQTLIKPSQEYYNSRTNTPDLKKIRLSSKNMKRIEPGAQYYSDQKTRYLKYKNENLYPTSTTIKTPYTTNEYQIYKGIRINTNPLYNNVSIGQRDKIEGTSVEKRDSRSTETRSWGIKGERKVYAKDGNLNLLNNRKSTKINHKEFMDRHQDNLIENLTEKFIQEQETNKTLIEEIQRMNDILAIESNKLGDLQEQCKEELKSFKLKENKTLESWNKLEKQSFQLQDGIRHANQKNMNFKRELSKLGQENSLLKNELKRLGDIAGAKILDLENNLNSMTRMKEFETDNFEMEREKINNSSEFVIQQMKTQFAEKTKKIQGKEKQIFESKSKYDKEIRGIEEDLRIFNLNADQKINILMNDLINEEESKQNEELQKLEQKINVEETKIQELLSEMEEKLRDL